MKIKITGEKAEGKSTLAAILGRYLQVLGYEVEHEDDHEVVEEYGKNPNLVSPTLRLKKVIISSE